MGSRISPSTRNRNDSGKLIWYPDPKDGHGDQKFNVFNLDPFVWFVHVQLKFSGYGFSLDDDIANVGAGYATRLQMTIGGPAKLKNTNEWTIQAPYGPVMGDGAWDPAAYAGVRAPRDRRHQYLTHRDHRI